MLKNLKAMGCRISLKVFADLEKIKNNLGTYPVDQGERFHQNIA